MSTMEKLRIVKICNASNSSVMCATKLLKRIEAGASERIARTFLNEWMKEYPEFAMYVR